MHTTLNHFADPDFWFQYRQLPGDIRALADKSFALLKSNPRHSETDTRGVKNADFFNRTDARDKNLAVAAPRQ